MTDIENKNTTRSTLTLKLPSSAGSQTLTLKTPETKKTGSSLVQVTIKGRKKENIDDRVPTALNKSEFEARMKAVSESKAEVVELKTHEILSKITKEKRKLAEEESGKNEVTKQEEIKEDVKEEYVVAKVEEKSSADIVEEKAQPQKVNSNYSLDSFDVRNKIRQSIEVTNRQKEEREKLIGVRKKEEQDRLEKEKVEREKRKAANKKTMSGGNHFKTAGKLSESEEVARKDRKSVV